MSEDFAPIRRFKHKNGKDAINCGKNYDKQATFIEEKNGKFYVVLKNGHRQLGTWNSDEAEMFLKEGWWIEVK